MNSRTTDVFGFETYKRITDIPDPVDLAVFIVPVPSVLSVVREV